MFSYFLAILSAFLFAFSFILVRKGLEHSTPLNALFFSMISQGVCLWIFGGFTISFDSLRWSIIWPFLLAGIFVPACARYFNYLGIEKVGVVINGSVINTAPFFALTSGILLLREDVNLSIFIGTSLIIIGLIFLSFKGGNKSSWKRKNLLIPIIAAFLYGTSPSLIKYGLEIVSSPVLAATVQVTTSIILVSIFFFGLGQGGHILLRKEGLCFFMGAGILTFLGILSRYTALLKGTVVTVFPLSNSFGLFTIFLSYFFLRTQEKVTWRIVVGAVLIFLGSSTLIYFNPIN